MGQDNLQIKSLNVLDDPFKLFEPSFIPALWMTLYNQDNMVRVEIVAVPEMVGKGIVYRVFNTDSRNPIEPVFRCG
jgi:hypothetical protein